MSVLSDDSVRLRFLHNLSEMTEWERNNLLRLEHEPELAALWSMAMRERLTDVAATIEVHADSRGVLAGQLSGNAPPPVDEPKCEDHDWQFRDESFSHEFGCERVHFWECSKCGATKPTCDADYGQPEPDDDCEIP